MNFNDPLVMQFHFDVEFGLNFINSKNLYPDL